MKPFFASYTSEAYASMRIVTGFLFLCHGSQKLFNIPVGMPAGAPPFIVYGAGSIELVTGALVLIGLFTHWAAFLASGEMAVAYWMVHGPKALFPIQNNGELAVLYCFAFLYICTRGGGIWSIDAAGTKDPAGSIR